MLYIVTNRKLVKQGTLYEAVERAAQSGADAVILREKDLSYDELYPMAQKLKQITDRFGIPLLVNGNAEVAEAIEAYGYHWGFESFWEVDRREGLRLGLSVHSIVEAVEAEKLGADYIIAGNIFETDCKPGLLGRGLSFVRELAESVDIPVIAIGGISPDNITGVMEAGASGAAIMSSAMTDYDGSLVRCLREKIDIYKEKRR